MCRLHKEDATNFTSEKYFNIPLTTYVYYPFVMNYFVSPYVWQYIYLD